MNKLYLVPKEKMAGLVGVLRNGGGLGICESYIPAVLFDSIMHRSPCFPDVDFSAFTGNPINHTILINLLSRSVTEAEVSLLKKGLKFAVTPAEIPATEIIAKVESAVR